MQCRECASELRIAKSETVVYGDKAPDTQTRVNLVQTLVCTNKQCGMYKKTAEKMETQIFPD